MKHIGVEDVPFVIRDLTNQIEARNECLQSIIATGNAFERWWQFALVAELARPPWHRKPGWNTDQDLGVGQCVELTVDPADGRFRYARDEDTPDQSRVDLVVRASVRQGAVHLIELKVVPYAFRERQRRSLENDIASLRTVVDWDDVASAWSIFMLHGFPDESDMLAFCETIDWGWTTVLTETELLPLHGSHGATLVGVRVHGRSTV